LALFDFVLHLHRLYNSTPAPCFDLSSLDDQQLAHLTRMGAVSFLGMIIPWGFGRANDRGSLTSVEKRSLPNHMQISATRSHFTS